MSRIFNVLFLTASLTTISCSKVFTAVYGIHLNRRTDSITINHYAVKYNVPLEDSYWLDTTYTSSVVGNSPDTSIASSIKNHLQPLQALYYKTSGGLQSFYINCYCGGFPNLNWNRNGSMACFPPKEQAPIDSLVPLHKQLHYARSFPQTKPFSVADYDYVVIVYWSQMMGRQSKRLIKTVQQNTELAKEIKTKVLYMNTDNMYSLKK